MLPAVPECFEYIALLARHFAELGIQSSQVFNDEQLNALRALRGAR